MLLLNLTTKKQVVFDTTIVTWEGNNMYIILLAGGSGKRLWPLSNAIRSKQFLLAYPSEDGKDGTMVSHVLHQIKLSNPDEKILVATNQKSAITLKALLNGDIEFCVEPEQRDTFPAITLALAYLHDVKGISDDEEIIICPVDVDTSQIFFDMFVELKKAISEGPNIALIGIQPDYPSDQFAYVLPSCADNSCSALWYHEKPSVEQARKYIDQGALWSGGVYAFKLGYILEEAHKIIDFIGYTDLYNKYKTLKKRSFARTIAEKEDHIQIIRYRGEWSDLGNWEAFLKNKLHDKSEYVLIDSTCENLHVINELHIPALCIGCKEMIVAICAGGILISSVKDSTKIKPFVEKISQQIMFAEKSWGSFLVLDIQKESLTIKISLLRGHHLNYHSHQQRDEIWVIISGTGKVVVDGRENDVQKGDVIKLPIGCKHNIYAKSNLKIIEFQLGKQILIEDMTVYSIDSRNHESAD